MKWVAWQLQAGALALVAVATSIAVTSIVTVTDVGI